MNEKQAMSVYLETKGIEHTHIKERAGQIIVIVPIETLSKLLERMLNGDIIDGKFMAQVGQNYTALTYYGKICYETGLSEMNCTRYLLGEVIGRKRISSRYAGSYQLGRGRDANAGLKAINL